MSKSIAQEFAAELGMGSTKWEKPDFIPVPKWVQEMVEKIAAESRDPMKAMG